MAERRVIPLTRPSAEPLPPAASLRDIHLRRGGKAILNGLNLTLSPTGITALLGPNGAGKSLLLRIMAGLVRADKGTVDLDPALAPPAMVFQKPVLLRRAVRANLAHTLRLMGQPRRSRPDRIAELLATCDLSHRADDPARALSGGEQQRLAMARALAGHPKLLFLDEPTASLDPKATAAIETIILRAAGQGVKIVLVTHSQSQAQRLAGDVVFLHQGRVAEESPAKTFFDAPKSRAAAAYLAGQLPL